MAISATVYSLEIALNDADRGVYESLAFRVARHPSESTEFLATRILAYCLEYSEGLAFSKGLSDPDAPAMSIRDLTGELRSWIEVGLPEAPRLHKASKASPRVAIYPHKDPAQMLARLGSDGGIYRAQSIEIHAIDHDLLSGFSALLDRRMKIDLAVSDRQLYLAVGTENLSGAVILHHLA